MASAASINNNGISGISMASSSIGNIKRAAQHQRHHIGAQQRRQKAGRQAGGRGRISEIVIR